MNILYYLSGFPKLSESFVLNEVYELEKRGHTVAVFAMNDPDEEFEHEEYSELDVPVRYAEFPNYTDAVDLLSPKVVRPSVLKEALYWSSPTQYALALHRSKQCIEYVDELPIDIDLVHTHFATLGRIPARYVASYYDVPFTVTAHAADLYDDPDGNQLSHVLNEADQIVTISEYNKRYIEDEITAASPVDVVRAGIRPEKFEPSPSTVDGRVLTVCRFVEKKGLPCAIQALSKVIDRFPRIEYHIVGAGPLGDELRRHIDEYGLADDVELLGKISDEQLITEFDEAACFLLPCTISESGDRDGIPVVLMEAMAMETPPISTEVSGIPELIDDRQNGLLVPPDDPIALADALSTIFSDSEKRHRYGSAGRQKVIDEFNVEKEADKLESLFLQVTSQ